PTGATTVNSRSANRLPASLSQPKLALRHSTAGRRAPTLVTGLHPASRPRPARPTPCTTWRRLPAVMAAAWHGGARASRRVLLARKNVRLRRQPNVRSGRSILILERRGRMPSRERVMGERSAVIQLVRERLLTQARAAEQLGLGVRQV